MRLLATLVATSFAFASAGILLDDLEQGFERVKSWISTPISPVKPVSVPNWASKAAAASEPSLPSETHHHRPTRMLNQKHHFRHTRQQSHQAMVHADESRNSNIGIHVTQPGKGMQPNYGSIVKVHYTGRLVTGQKFDSSYDRGRPIEFKLGMGRVIPCWDQAIESMRVGEKATLTCPPDLAYGHRGHPPKIPQDATLVFDVELVDAFDRR